MEDARVDDSVAEGSKVEDSWVEDASTELVGSAEKVVVTSTEVEASAAAEDALATTEDEVRGLHVLLLWWRPTGAAETETRVTARRERRVLNACMVSEFRKLKRVTSLYPGG